MSGALAPEDLPKPGQARLLSTEEMADMMELVPPEEMETRDKNEAENFQAQVRVPETWQHKLATSLLGGCTMRELRRSETLARSIDFVGAGGVYRLAQTLTVQEEGVTSNQVRLWRCWPETEAPPEHTSYDNNARDVCISDADVKTCMIGTVTGISMQVSANHERRSSCTYPVSRPRRTCCCCMTMTVNASSPLPSRETRRRTSSPPSGRCARAHRC